MYTNYILDVCLVLLFQVLNIPSNYAKFQNLVSILDSGTQDRSNYLDKKKIDNFSGICNCDAIYIICSKATLPGFGIYRQPFLMHTKNKKV